MKGLVFDTTAPPLAAAPARNDVACFIGLVEPRADAEPPAALRRWLIDEGWWAEEGGQGLRPGSLLDVPLPLRDWEEFDALFAWDRRDYGKLLGQPVNGAGYLGAALRSFFAQGGRKCYLVAMGAPLAYGATRAERDDALARLVPPLAGGRPRREEWHGIEHLLGLPEASFVAFPDLAELSADYSPAATPAPEVAPVEPVFTACSAK